MGSFSIWHWLIVLAVVLILFGGRGKLSQLMGDFGKGMKAFKQSMKDDEGFEEKGNSSGAPKALASDGASPQETPRSSQQPERDRAVRP